MSFSSQSPTRRSSSEHATLGFSAYEYDPLGNRLWSPLSGDISVRFDYDDRNRLAWASQPLRPTALTLEWDHANRLVRSSDGASYRYDGHDRRVAKTEGGATTVYHYDTAGRVIAETLADGTKLRDYVYLGAKLVAVDGCMEGAVASGCTLRQWYHTDTLGSVRARTDAEGTVVASFDYKPFGEQAEVGGVAGNRQYNGRVFDPGTGFHDYGARLYWPEIGRFVSADSYRGEPANPASLNLYSYVHNNPYKYVDPSGHNPLLIGVLVALLFIENDQNANLAPAAAAACPTCAAAAFNVAGAKSLAGGNYQEAEQAFFAALASGVAAKATAGETAVANSAPKPSPKFKEPTNPAQAPPSEVPPGWRVRQMGATEQYPDGYWKLEKPMKDGSWQPIDPSTMKPGTRPQTHVPLPPKKPE